MAAAKAADFASTFYFDPHLSREANPLTTLLGLYGWNLVAAILLILVCLLPLMALYVFYGPASMSERPANLREYMALQLYGCKLSPMRFWKALSLGWPLPKNKLQVLRMLGFSLPWAIAFSCLQATFSWWAVIRWKWEWYAKYRNMIGFANYPIIEIISALVVFFCLQHLFFRMEFQGCYSQLPNTERWTSAKPSSLN